MIEEPAPAAGERQRSIALVDDDRNILTTLSIALQAEGYATRVYSDGEAALKALLENPPDLAVFDIKMPRMDGMELLRRLRATSELPVIFLTSKDEEQDEEAGGDYAAGEIKHIQAATERAAEALHASAPCGPAKRRRRSASWAGRRR